MIDLIACRINQTAIDHAVDILNRGGWVHIFPEAKISQNSIEKPLLPFKWGVGRLLTEPRLTPVVVPIIHHGTSSPHTAVRKTFDLLTCH